MLEFMLHYQDYLADWMPRLMAGVRTTAALSILGFLLALLLGSLLAAALMNRRRWVRSPAMALVQVMRAIPLLALLLSLYFGLPPLGITLRGFDAGVLGLGLIGSAYIAEIVRGSLTALHHGQREAALATGMTPRAAMLHILLPQAARSMLPPLMITFVSLLKDTSLCALIATDELMLAAKAIASESFLPLQIFILAGLFYFAVAWPLSMLARLLEKRLRRDLRRVGN
ncbi:polar amino acid transport system permease protein [Herbaspirillum sp. Sphag1AN]|uniref:amino acid ABC transporter permease n=1 Tax=unclassified Herbaspirillum TaxID=2624150 RepID=UPI00161D254D|nr:MULTISPECIES: amino acid ABC transporter permease [unclassified Herbaspirillum]MBB3212757.1 polar amino acid transport system permease protein [Herbaspirillum sp. Sphag1AN]MBB3245954.1 polar amino acid transport system permease protein [Herbaspirillum sp. Sphag64]